MKCFREYTEENKRMLVKVLFCDCLADLDTIIARATAHGVDKMICAGTDLKSCEFALNATTQYGNYACHFLASVYGTIGIHPTCSNEWSKHGTLDALRSMLSKSKKIVAIGECGLDYDRLQFADKETQIRNFYHLTLE